MVARHSQAKVNPTMDDFFYAIGKVETENNDNAIGDGGKSIGRYQIQYNYWLDSKIGYGTYKDCKKKEYAEKVMTKYWERYCPKALQDKDFERLSRTHNGGPNGANIKATEKYWQKVKNILDNEI
jgi:predicted chitinase